MNTDNKWSLSNAYGNIENQKETGSIHLYICNSKAHLVKSGCLCPTNYCFVYAGFCIISAFKQTKLLFFLKNKTSAAPTDSASRAQEWHVSSAVDSQRTLEQIKTKLVSNSFYPQLDAYLENWTTVGSRNNVQWITPKAKSCSVMLIPNLSTLNLDVIPGTIFRRHSFRRYSRP